ncbi:DUF5131 family protein [Methylovirgula sp. HY1]|uniref:DUF5131 family protein n=1 Tax=Methylovirgula sp. HY1 TaxID=2822761 RepID=UPI001C5AC20A|nr:phage Gp37/Gp68 family protein [Methylovirgula sp. HY1]QXX74273.1 hypothetical protein MHY1_01083 [Methylovirgula sp. HY1]
MSDRSKIEWTDATWNPIRAITREGKIGWHCEKISAACANCYAEAMNQRLGTGLEYHSKHFFYDDKRSDKKSLVFLDEKTLLQPLHWKRPRRIFVCSMTDLFGDWVTDEMRDRIHAIMALTPHHDYQILTKRSARMRQYATNPATPPRIWAAVDALIDLWNSGGAGFRLRAIDNDPKIVALADQGASWGGETPWPLKNVWFGVTAENQQAADKRIPDLLATSATMRFVSIEPMLGPIDLERIGTLDTIRSAMPEIVAREEDDLCQNSVSGMQIDVINSAHQATIYYQTPDHMGGFAIRFPRPFPRLDWVICGGESGPHARPMHPDWARSLRDQCAAASVPFFFKQWGEFREFDHETREITLVEAGSDFAESVLAAACNPSWITADGRHIRNQDDLPEHGEPRARLIERVGKKSAGRLLDGREHSEFPGRQA